MTIEYIMVRIKPKAFYLTEEDRDAGKGITFEEFQKTAEGEDLYDDFINPAKNNIVNDIWKEHQIDDDKVTGVVKLEKNRTFVTDEGHLLFVAQGYDKPHYAVALEPDEFVIMGDL